MRIKFVMSMAAATLAGCETTGGSDLQVENTNLRQQLEASQAEIGQLRGTNLLLNRDIENLNQVISVLDTEKNSRIVESSVLREKVRFFVQNQVDVLSQFLVDGDLLDYIGGELVQRPNTEDEPFTLVNLSNVINSGGVLTGMGAFVINPCQVRVIILRNLEGELVTLWQSEIITLPNTGLVTYQFTNSVSVEPGDLIAYEFQDIVGVGYDTGTGDTRYTARPLVLGGAVPMSSLLGANDKRAYSIGVFGLLNL